MTDALRPFTAAVPDAAIQDLKDRLARTRWPEKEAVDDWSQGIPLAYLQEVCDYWATSYDWRRLEKQLNGWEQGLTTIDGCDIHYIHAPSPEPDAKPLIITHGWPGSIVEYVDIIEPLRDPVAHGGKAEDAYHVVVPSLPGYGFSGKPTETGWNIQHVATAWVELMKRLGYPQFYAQGGDWGGIVTTELGTATHSDAVLGIHINLAICNPEALFALGEPTEKEMEQLGKFGYYMEWENGYSQQQSTRPQTLGYGLTDSPAGQCGWILEKFHAWVDHDGHPEDVVSRDKLLDNISVYWFNATAASSARMYWESFKPLLANFGEVTAPTAYSCFDKDVFTFTERWTRTRYTDLRYYSVPSKGGHFAATEQPQIFVDEVRAGLRAIRS